MNNTFNNKDNNDNRKKTPKIIRLISGSFLGDVYPSHLKVNVSDVRCLSGGFWLSGGGLNMKKFQKAKILLSLLNRLVG